MHLSPENIINQVANRLFPATFDAISLQAHVMAREKGFYEGVDSDSPAVAALRDAQRIALIHSELTEALEAIRQGNPPDDKIPQFTGAEAELADAIIRIMDFAAFRGYRVGDAIAAKMAFNATRPEKHGKKF